MSRGQHYELPVSVAASSCQLPDFASRRRLRQNSVVCCGKRTGGKTRRIQGNSKTCRRTFPCINQSTTPRQIQLKSAVATLRQSKSDVAVAVTVAVAVKHHTSSKASLPPHCPETTSFSLPLLFCFPFPSSSPIGIATFSVCRTDTD